MPFRHGKNTKVLFGVYDLSSYFNEASSSTTVEVAETTAYGNNSKTYVTGLADGTMSLSGMFDGAANAVDVVLSASLGQDPGSIITIAPEGLAIGSRVKSGQTITTSYEVTSPVADVVSVSAEAQVTGDTSHAVSLHDLTAETATGNATSNDNSASSANGGIGVLHVTANSMNNTTIIKVQHSSDNSTWADLVTFTTVSATTTTSQRSTVAAGTTVNRYLRANWTAAGTGSITFHVNFSRS